LASPDYSQGGKTALLATPCLPVADRSKSSAFVLGENPHLRQ
jgi:hypothetical protein